MAPTDSEWISAAESSRLFRKGAKWLQQNRVPMKTEDSGLIVYERAQIEQLIEETRELALASAEGPDGQVTSGVAASVKALADSVKATEALIRQVLGHHEKLFAQYDAANQGIYKTLREHLEHQNAHVMNLEKHQLEFRVIMERALSQQHEREIATQESERRGRMQEQAAKQIGATLLPWLGPFVGKKLGIDAPSSPPVPAPAESNGAPSDTAKVGQFAIQLLASMNEGQFEAMKRAVGPDVAGPLELLRASILKGEISP